MSEQKTTTLPVMDCRRQEDINYGLVPARYDELQECYKPFMERANQHLADASYIIVKDDADVAGMMAARETRLALKAIRVEVEKTRKALKANALREGKAVDGMANVIKYVIEPVEEDLKEKEDIVKRAEERRKEKLAQERKNQLEAFDVDCQHFDLVNMEDEAFANLLQSSEAGFNARIAAEEAERQWIEAERIAKEKAEAERLEAERVKRERIAAENEALRKQAIEAEKKRKAAEEKQRELEAERIAAERIERKRIEDEERAKIKAERERIEREQAEINRRKAEKAEAERIENERIAAMRQAEADRKAREEAEAAQAMLQAKYDAMLHKATCPKCGHIFDAIVG